MKQMPLAKKGGWTSKEYETLLHDDILLKERETTLDKKLENNAKDKQIEGQMSLFDEWSE